MPPQREMAIRRAIRGAAAVLIGALIVYLVAKDINESRENQRLLKELETQQAKDREATIKSLAEILELVKAGEDRAAQTDAEPKITLDQAIEALKKTFPPELVEQAVQRTTVGPRGPTGPAGPQGPQGPAGTSSQATGTASTTTSSSTTMTTSTTRPPPPTTATTRCQVNVLGVIKAGCQ